MLPVEPLEQQKKYLLPEYFRVHPFRIVVGFVLVLFFIGMIFSVRSTKKPLPVTVIPTVTLTPTPKKEEPFGMYAAPKIAKKDVYILALVGDSMTEALGPHGGKLSELLNTRYQSTPGNQRIVIDNYAKGSTSILTLHEVIASLPSKHVDLILIESFGYNPLSQFPSDEGLKKQSEVLDGLMKVLTKKYPNTVIVFVATIAPNKETYAQEVSQGKSVAERVSQAEERMAYIRNHMDFAKAHNIPLIDIYSKSLTPEGNGKLIYINPNDHIHPSFAGIEFIGHEIANYIYENKILPQ